VVAIACSTGADMMGEIMDSGVPDADAQAGECPCEQGLPGEQELPGEQGEQGPQGAPGPSGIVAATSFIPENNPTATGITWVCEFGTSQLTVGAGQRLLMTAQGTGRFLGNFNGGWGEISLAGAWREVGDTSEGTMGHFVTTQVDDIVGHEVALHTTELTPPLAEGLYETGMCVRKEGNNNFGDVTILRPYGTALVINAGG